MLNRILEILTVLLSIQSTLCLNTADLCRSSSVCKGKYNYQCGKYICSSNEETCANYHEFKHANMFRLLHMVRNFQSNMRSCDTQSFDLNANDYCLKDLSCSKKQYVWKMGIITYKIKQNCKCEGKLSFKCGNNHCTLDNKHCNLLNTMKQNENEFKKHNFHNCLQIYNEI
jgi:hypothetical protein